MTVAEDETVDIGVGLQVFPCIYGTIFLVHTHEWSIALHLMFEHAVARPAKTHPDAPTGMHHREHPLQETVVEYRTQKAEALLGRELVAMGKEELLVV